MNDSIYYRGWHLTRSTHAWAAVRFGVRMRAQSPDQLKRMIDLRLADEQRARDVRARDR
jgi:hypothetical protein